MARRKKRQLEPMICGKCGNDGLMPRDVANHGVGRCTNANNRPDYCPLCHEDFYTARETTMRITNFGKMKKAAAAGESTDAIRETRDVVRRTKWPARKIYKHLEEHRRTGDTPEDFA